MAKSETTPEEFLGQKVFDETEHYYLLANNDGDRLSHNEMTVKGDGQHEYRLHRLIAKHDFTVGDVQVKKGQSLGFVESASNIAGDAIVDNTSVVYGNAVVTGKAIVSDWSVIYGETDKQPGVKVYDRPVLIEGKARVSHSLVTGCAQIEGESQVSGAHVCDEAKLLNASVNGKFEGTPTPYDYSHGTSNCKISGQSALLGYVKVSDSRICDASVQDNAEVSDSSVYDARIREDAQVSDCWIDGQDHVVHIEGHSVVSGSNVRNSTIAGAAQVSGSNINHSTVEEYAVVSRSEVRDSVIRGRANVQSTKVHNQTVTKTEDLGNSITNS